MGSFKYQFFLKAFFFFLPGLTACGLRSDSVNAVAAKKSTVGQGCTTQTTSATTADLDSAYGSTVWNIATAGNRCSQCHGGSQSPKFALLADIPSSRANALPYLSGATSIIETRAGDGHCGANCSDSTTMKAAVAQYLQTQGMQTSQCIPVGGSGSSASPPTPSTSPTPLTQQELGKLTYDSYCLRCHKLGSYDTVGSPDIRGKGGDIQEKFTSGVASHKDIVLKQMEIDALRVYVNLF